jgi:hypothetical protein
VRPHFARGFWGFYEIWPKTYSCQCEKVDWQSREAADPARPSGTVWRAADAGAIAC